jgi:hypothetical protein
MGRISNLENTGSTIKIQVDGLGEIEADIVFDPTPGEMTAEIESTDKLQPSLAFSGRIVGEVYGIYKVATKSTPETPLQGTLKVDYLNGVAHYTLVLSGDPRVLASIAEAECTFQDTATDLWSITWDCPKFTFNFTGDITVTVQVHDTTETPVLRWSSNPYQESVANATGNSVTLRIESGSGVELTCIALIAMKARVLSQNIISYAS